jgi:hypothetical protein
MMDPKPGLVESLDGIVRDAAPVFCRCGDRIAHRGAADESDSDPVALDDGEFTRFGEITTTAAAHDASLIQNIQATEKRIQAVPRAWIVGDVHDIEACPSVGVEHPLIGSWVVVVIIRREILGIGHHGFQVAEGDVCVFEQMLRSGESRIRIGATHESIAHQHHFDVTHNEPPSRELCDGLSPCA